MNDTPSLEDIVAALKREHDDAEDFYCQVLQPEQEAANRYYDAEPFGDEMEGRSQIVLPIVAEVIDYALPSIKRQFLTADRIVEIEATSEDDEPGADEATVSVHYNFMREQDGARLINDWLQSGLMERIGVIKTVCETEEKVSRERFLLDVEQAVALDAGELPLGEGEEVEDLTENEDGTFSATIKRTKIVKRYIDVPIPANEFRFARNARHEDSADFLEHVCLKTRSDLVEMGFDPDQVADLPTSDSLGIDGNYRDSDYERDTNGLPSELQQVLLHESYARMDVDGDGIAERVKVFWVGDQVLIDAETGEPSIETITEQPFVVFCPFPRAHRLVGNSLADKAMDSQRIESVNARQMQDGMYLANMPRPLVDMGSGDYSATTLEDLLRPIAGSPIRYKGQAPQPYEAGLDISKSLAAAEFWKSERESRTGITRLNQGLDADTLNKTATGAALVSAQGQQIEEDMASNFGQSMARLFAKKVRLMRAEGARFPVKYPQPKRLPDGTTVKYGMADASNWPEDFRLIIRVGLGTGRKEQRLQYLFALSPLMVQAYEAGLATKRGLYRYGHEVVSAMQLGQGDDFFENPEGVAEEPEADPEAAARDAEVRKEIVKAEAKAAGDQMKGQIDLTLNREKMAREAQLRREEMAMEYDLKTTGMLVDAETKRTQINDSKAGGSLAK